MNTKIIVIVKLIAHYLWINRDPIFQLWKEIKKDGRLTLSDLYLIFDFYKKSGFIPEENDKVFVGGITELLFNKSKNLVQYNQSNRSCAIYSRTRVAMYNVKGLVYSRDEVEAIVQMAKDKGYLQTTGSNKGMTFANADKVITEWTLANKGIQLKYDKVKYGSEEDLARKKLGYAKSIGGGISGQYIKDFRLDGEINMDYNFSEKILYYHAFTREPDDKCTENYPTQFGVNNRYKNDLIEKFIEKGVFFTRSYYIMSDQEIVTDIIQDMKEDQIFKDVNGSTEFYNSIKWAKEQGIVNGYSDGTLRPQENITVGRMLAILQNYDKSNKN